MTFLIPYTLMVLFAWRMGGGKWSLCFIVTDHAFLTSAFLTFFSRGMCDGAYVDTDWLIRD